MLRYILNKFHTKKETLTKDNQPLSFDYFATFDLNFYDKNQMKVMISRFSRDLMFNKTVQQKYNILKNYNFQNADFTYLKTEYNQDDYLKVLAAASFNKNGFVREKAIKLLSELKDKDAIPYLIYRLADWVPQVRNSASEGLLNFKKTEYLLHLIDNLQNFGRIGKAERVDIKPIFDIFLNFLIFENQDFIIENYEKIKDKTRLIIAKKLIEKEDIEEKIIQLLLQDKLGLIRQLLIKRFDILSENHINTILGDKLGQIRCLLLYALKDKRLDFYQIIFNFIADESESCRRLARFSLKNHIQDFASIYVQNLKENKAIIGSILGLGDLEAKQHSHALIPFLEHSNINIVKTALLTLAKLDETLAYDFAIEKIGTSWRLNKICIDCLAQNTDNRALEKARFLFQSNILELQRLALNLFLKIGGRVVITDLILACANENPDIRNEAVYNLFNWKKEIVNNYRKLKDTDIIKAKEALEKANQIITEKHYFTQNPLDNLVFFIE